MHHAARDGLDRGASMLVIVADPSYHAIVMYRELGFADTGTKVQLTRPPAATG